MLRLTAIAFAVLAFATAATAHFVFVIPDAKNPEKAIVVFSDELAPDANVDIGKIAAIKLQLRDPAGKDSPLTATKAESALAVNVSGKGNRIVFGTIDYGVMQRGEGKPFLLRYHPKAMIGFVDSTKVGEKLPIEIVPIVAKGKAKFLVLSKGKPLPEAEVNVIGEKKEKLVTDKEGMTSQVDAKGVVGLWTKASEAVSGELGGKKYEEVRNYATLVVDLEAKTPTAARELVPLAKGTTSFGAAVSDGYVYLYGGHTGKPHSYSNATTSPKFYRLSLANPAKWEELPDGPIAQGVAVVAHEGKIYRIGGMQPRNKPEDKTDSHSLASVARYDVKTGKWEDLPDMPEGRSSHDAVILNNVLYVAGGWQMNGAGKESTWLKNALRLDLSKTAMKWELIEQPFQRRALTMATHGGKIYVIAGLNSGGTAERTVNVFDPSNNSWSKATDIPEGAMNGFTPAACSCDGRLFLSPADGKVYRLTEKGDSWEEVATLANARVVHRMVPTGKGQMLVIGGSSKGAPTSSVEVVEIRK